jgi:hypothetical protein
MLSAADFEGDQVREGAKASIIFGYHDWVSAFAKRVSRMGKPKTGPCVLCQLAGTVPPEGVCQAHGELNALGDVRSALECFNDDWRSKFATLVALSSKIDVKRGFGFSSRTAHQACLPLIGRYDALRHLVTVQSADWAEPEPVVGKSGLPSPLLKLDDIPKDSPSSMPESPRYVPQVQPQFTLLQPEPTTASSSTCPSEDRTVSPAPVVPLLSPSFSWPSSFSFGSTPSVSTDGTPFSFFPHFVKKDAPEPKVLPPSVSALQPHIKGIAKGHESLTVDRAYSSLSEPSSRASAPSERFSLYRGDAIVDASLKKELRDFFDQDRVKQAFVIAKNNDKGLSPCAYLFAIPQRDSPILNWNGFTRVCEVLEGFLSFTDSKGHKPYLHLTPYIMVKHKINSAFKAPSADFDYLAHRADVPMSTTRCKKCHGPMSEKHVCSCRRCGGPFEDGKRHKCSKTPAKAEKGAKESKSSGCSGTGDSDSSSESLEEKSSGPGEKIKADKVMKDIKDKYDAPPVATDEATVTRTTLEYETADAKGFELNLPQSPMQIFTFIRETEIFKILLVQIVIWMSCIVEAYVYHPISRAVFYRQPDGAFNRFLEYLYGQSAYTTYWSWVNTFVSFTFFFFAIAYCGKTIFRTVSFYLRTDVVIKHRFEFIRKLDYDLSKDNRPESMRMGAVKQQDPDIWQINHRSIVWNCTATKNVVSRGMFFSIVERPIYVSLTIMKHIGVYKNLNSYSDVSQIRRQLETSMRTCTTVNIPCDLLVQGIAVYDDTMTYLLHHLQTLRPGVDVFAPA